MEFLSTRNCLEQIMRTMGTLEVSQVERFFRNAPDIANLNLYVSRFVGYHIFDYSETKKRLSYHSFPATKDDIVNRRITAFWIPASFGYDNVREIILLKYPSQILFISEDNEVYDVTVCTCEEDASIAERIREHYATKGIEDDVNHIAVVRNADLGREALKHGFDSYCILDEYKHPTYYNE